ncbi:hypothetical protein PSH03_003386 [Micromonospora sp. PSH03]|uniref:CATRA system-associated protein n=1 Tax=Micromonospora salmantinae TaxID=2911211 RepID=UPI001EE8E146|nr:CATRA system-associated protein [Micromonospora salmantinae]MCG5458208.1 hypothetical protein [Micromonospora salmantinae]
MTTAREFIFRAVAEETDLLLSRVETWQLPPDRWPAVDAALAEVAGAMAAGDPAALRSAAALLESTGPGRITRLGAEPPQDPPPPIRDRIVRIVHRRSEPPPTPPESEPNGND